MRFPAILTILLFLTVPAVAQEGTAVDINSPPPLAVESSLTANEAADVPEAAVPEQSVLPEPDAAVAEPPVGPETDEAAVPEPRAEDESSLSEMIQTGSMQNEEAVGGVVGNELPPEAAGGQDSAASTQPSDDMEPSAADAGTVVESQSPPETDSVPDPATPQAINSHEPETAAPESEPPVSAGKGWIKKPGLARVGGFGGYTFWGNAEDARPAYGFQAEIRLTDHAGIELAVSQMEDRYQDKAIYMDLDITRFELSFIGRTDLKPVGLYVVAGGNYSLPKLTAVFDTEFYGNGVNTATQINRAFGAHAGLGVNFPVWNGWALFSEFRYYYTDMDYQVAAEGTGRTQGERTVTQYSHGLFKIGINYAFK